MPWKKLFANVTGSIDEELRLRNEYLVAESRILRSKIKGQLRLKTEDRPQLAKIGKELGRKAPEAVIYTGNQELGAPGQGCDRIFAGLTNLGHRASNTTIANVLRKRWLPPLAERKKETTGHEFARNHIDVVVAAVFFTAEVWSRFGLRARIKSECLDRMILARVRSLHHVLKVYTAHYHFERNHQSIGNALIFPQSATGECKKGTIKCRERLGGCLSKSLLSKHPPQVYHTALQPLIDHNA